MASEKKISNAKAVTWKTFLLPLPHVFHAFLAHKSPSWYFCAFARLCFGFPAPKTSKWKKCTELWVKKNEGKAQQREKKGGERRANVIALKSQFIKSKVVKEIWSEKARKSSKNTRQFRHPQTPYWLSFLRDIISFAGHFFFLFFRTNLFVDWRTGEFGGDLLSSRVAIPLFFVLLAKIKKSESTKKCQLIELRQTH